VIELVTAEEVDEPVMIELFSIDGRSFSIEDRVRADVSLEYLYRCRRDGYGLAESWLLEKVLGNEAYVALMSFPQVTPEQVQTIVRGARATVFGEVQTTPGKEPGPRAATPKKATARRKG
jgi:hypothetical protein